MKRNKFFSDKTKRVYVCVLLALIALTLVFIFSQSISDIPHSRAESEKVTEYVQPILEPIIGKGNVTDTLVRKLAHFAEFALLGAELALLLRKLTAAQFLAALLVALSDETIQIFSGRGSQVQDVWLDFAGACFGLLAATAILCIWKKHKKAEQHEK